MATKKTAKKTAAKAATKAAKAPTKAVAKKTTTKPAKAAAKSTATKSAKSTATKSAKSTATKSAKSAPKRAARTSAIDLHAAFLAVPEARRIPPRVPSAELAQEAQDVFAAARPLRARLAAVGVSGELLDSLPGLAGAFAAAESRWRKARAVARGGAGDALQREAVEARREIVAAGRFLLRDDDDAQHRLDAIQDGEGLADLIQDLRDCAAFVTDYGEQLDAADVEGGITRLAARADELAELLSGAVSADRVDAATRDALTERDEAAIALGYALAEVRAAARYVLRGDEKRLRAFRSAYYARKRRGQPAPGDTDTDAEEGGKPTSAS